MDQPCRDAFSLYQRCISGGVIGYLQKRAGIKVSKKLTIAEAVNACDTNWLRLLMGDAEPSPATAPVLFAIKRRIETDDQTSWVAGWAATTGINSDEELPGIALGRQFYHERLVVAPKSMP